MDDSKNNRKTANKLNAQKSTGPTTNIGKSISALNSTKLGIYSRKLTFKDEQQRIEFTNLLRSLKKTYRPTKTLEKTYVDKIARGMWIESRVDHAIDELLLDPHSQEAPLRKFLEQSNLPEVAVPGLRSANGITNWSPGAVVLRMSTSEDENSTSFQKDTEHKSKNSEFELRMQPALERLMRYKEVLRRDLREAIKDLENLQKNRRVSEKTEPQLRSEATQVATLYHS